MLLRICLILTCSSAHVAAARVLQHSPDGGLPRRLLPAHPMLRDAGNGRASSSGSLTASKTSGTPVLDDLGPALREARERAARAVKDFAARLKDKPGRSRGELGEQGVVSEDGPAGAAEDWENKEWVRKTLAAGPTWSLKVDKGNVRVWRRSVRGARYDEIKGQGILNAPPEKVVALFASTDPKVIRRFNPLYDTGWDLERINKEAKVSYTRVRPISPCRPRDMITRVTQRRMALGADPLLSSTVQFIRSEEHPKDPQPEGYVRAQMLRGMNCIESIPGDPQRTKFTFTTLIDPGGFVPAWLANILYTQDASKYVERLNTALEH